MVTSIFRGNDEVMIYFVPREYVTSVSCDSPEGDVADMVVRNVPSGAGEKSSVVEGSVMLNRPSESVTADRWENCVKFEANQRNPSDADVLAEISIPAIGMPEYVITCPVRVISPCFGTPCFTLSSKMRNVGSL